MLGKEKYLKQFMGRKNWAKDEEAEQTKRSWYKLGNWSTTSDMVRTGRENTGEENLETGDGE